MKSQEHEDTIKFLSELKGLEIVTIRGNSNIAGQYFPDLKNSTTDYEVEVVPRKNYILKKTLKWDKSRKKVLVLKPNSFIYESFDEIYVILETKQLIKVK